jgi:hypothetical protein
MIRPPRSLRVTTREDRWWELAVSVVQLQQLTLRRQVDHRPTEVVARAVSRCDGADRPGESPRRGVESFTPYSGDTATR